MAVLHITNTDKSLFPNLDGSNDDELIRLNNLTKDIDTDGSITSEIEKAKVSIRKYTILLAYLK